MRKVILSLSIIIILLACHKETQYVEENMQPFGTVAEIRGDKVDVCHNGNIINISLNAVPAHQAHGDAVDMDNDGYFDIANECSTIDCVDSNANVNPGSTEIMCNFIDDDCNSLTPDSNQEICDNGVDDDCDGDIDENDGDCFTGCVEGELEVTLPDGSNIFVYPIDSDNNTGWGILGIDIIELDNADTPSKVAEDFDGEGNTTKIIDQLGDWANGNYAANICAALSEETGCNWYLPAIAELKTMYEQLGPAPNNNFSEEFYWSSSEFTPDAAWKHDFVEGLPFDDYKSDTSLSCRCVRK